MGVMGSGDTFRMLEDAHAGGEPTGLGIDGEVAVGDEFFEPASAGIRGGGLRREAR